MARVARAGGRVVVVDTTVPEDEALDREINRIETLRDPSHVRNYRVSEWRAMLEAAGLAVTYGEIDMYREGGRMDFHTWTSRMRTLPDAVAELERIFHTASPALREALDLEVSPGRIEFCLPLVTLVARKECSEQVRPARDRAACSH
jgi:hypothetical protein